MSKKYYTKVDFKQNQSEKFVVEGVTSFPANAKNGRLVYHETFTTIFVCINESGDTTLKGNWKTSTITIDDIDSSGSDYGELIISDGVGGSFYGSSDGGTL